MLKTVYFSYVVTMIAVLPALSLERESEKYTYDAKLLEKMIRMELKVEKMEKDIKETQSNVVTVLGQVSKVLENKTEELKLLQERVEMPIVAFSAYNPIDRSLDTNQILILQTVTLNKGDGYDNVIGIFTAPVTGLYYFTAHVCNYSNRGIYYDIILEHNPIAKSTHYNTAQYDCSSVTALTMVTTGQRVWVKCTSGNSSPQFYEDGHRRTTFSGVLLQR